MEHRELPSHSPRPSSSDSSEYNAVRKRYVFSYFIVICLGTFSYCT